MKASETGSIVKSPVAKRPSGRSAKPVCLSAEGTRKRGNFSDRKRWGAQTLTERKRPRARKCPRAGCTAKHRGGELMPEEERRQLLLEALGA